MAGNLPRSTRISIFASHFKCTNTHFQHTHTHLSANKHTPMHEYEYVKQTQQAPHSARCYLLRAKVSQRASRIAPDPMGFWAHTCLPYDFELTYNIKIHNRATKNVHKYKTHVHSLYSRRCGDLNGFERL